MRRWLGLLLVLLALASGMSARAESAGEGLEARADEVSAAVDLGGFQRAAADAGVELRQIEVRTQASDHPILWNVPETDYLKFYLFQVV